MRSPHDHVAIVRAWMEKASADESPQRMLNAFEEGFGGMWRRAHSTLGEVTLVAIVDRVMHDAARRFPIFSTLKLGSTGLDCVALREAANGLDLDTLSQALEFFLVQFLTILGNLTAGILNRALHSELVKLGSRVATARVEGDQP